MIKSTCSQITGLPPLKIESHLWQQHFLCGEVASGSQKVYLCAFGVLKVQSGISGVLKVRSSSATIALYTPIATAVGCMSGDIVGNVLLTRQSIGVSSIMVWGAFSVQYRSPMYLINRNLTDIHYRIKIPTCFAVPLLEMK